MDAFMSSSSPIDPSCGKILHDIPGFIRIYENGKVERLAGTDFITAGVDPSSGVQSKDVVISPETKVGARLYIPKTVNPGEKLPLLIFFHGGGFIIETAYSPTYHTFHNLLVPEANAVVVSVDYRLAPENPLPIPYEDCWEAIQWVASHANGGGPEPWLNDYADFQTVLFGGDSAGGNITHQMAIRVGLDPVSGINLEGIILLHPFFWGEEQIGGESKHAHVAAAFGLWEIAYPGKKGFDDPYINPGADPNLGKLGAKKVLVCAAEKDLLWDRGWYYKEALEKCGWKGEIEVMGTEGEAHVFFLFFPAAEKSAALRTKVCNFINQVKSKA